MSLEPALRFWLRYLERSGAAVVEAEDVALVGLPPALQEAFDLPEELSVTSDPEVAAEGEAQLVIPGHPLLDAAAARMLSEGDVGHRFLAWPRSTPPTTESLLEGVRDHHPVDHGRIDLQGDPIRVYVPVLRFGSLAIYSGEDRFLERLEAFVDAWAALPLAPALARRIALVPDAEGPQAVPVLAPRSMEALRAGAKELQRRAAERAGEIQAGDRGAMAAEKTRAETYYDAQLAQIAKRREGAPLERRQLYDAQEKATVEERQRRLREIADKFAVHSEVRPFRLHLLLAPALYLPVEVRRGQRRFPFAMHYLLETNSFLPVRCPHCRSAAPLVAGREYLGCNACLQPAKAAATEPKPTPAPTFPSRVAVAPSRDGHATTHRKSAALRRPEPQPAAPKTPPPPPARPAVARPTDPAQPDLFAEHALPEAPPPPAPPRPAPAAAGVAAAAVTAQGVQASPTLAQLTQQFLTEALRGKPISVPIDRHSPLDVLLRLFDWQGVFVALDMDYPLAPLQHYRLTLDALVAPDILNARIRTEGVSLRFSVIASGSGSDLRLSELLPFWAGSTHGLAPLARSGQVRALLDGPPPGGMPMNMNRIEWTLFVDGGATFHLAILLRAMSLWRRVRRHIDNVAPEVAASALVELVLDASNLLAPDHFVAGRFHADPNKSKALRARIDAQLAQVTKRR